MLDLVRKTHEEFGISLMLSSHLMGDVERTCDRIIVIEAGRVLRQGEVTSFTEELETLFVEVDDRRPEFLAALQRQGIKAEEVDSAVIIENVADADYDKILRALAEAEAPLRRMGPRRHALTEIFTEPAEAQQARA
jgi:ABC-2 type transport system ATP-binding protein